VALIVRGKSYPSPNEGDQPGLLGKELMAIEDAFGIDALTLFGTLESDKPSTLPGYTKAKAFYALAWICMTRAGEIVSIQDVLNEYSIDEFTDGEIELKKELTVSSEAVQEPRSEAISLS
jgi:hypothetical protein